MKPPVTELLKSLARDSRILLLGGLAVIAHGLERATKDADAWLEPLKDVGAWANRVARLLRDFPACELQRLGTWDFFPDHLLPDVIEQDRVVRIVGADRPLDLFRQPHMLTCEDFDLVWEAATPLDHGIRLPDEVDLLLTKEETGRDVDVTDISYLQAKAERRFAAVVTEGSLEEATRVFDRFLTRNLAVAALANPNPDVAEAALTHLKELASAGDPYADEFLKKQPRGS